VKLRVVLLAMAALCAARYAEAGTLVINANASDPAPRAAWEAAVTGFRADNSDVSVRLNLYDHESYKRSLRNWLTGAAPDVVFWFAGHRMRELALPRLLEDVSDLFTPEIRGQLHPGAVGLVSAEGRQYGVPYTYYHVGLYVRRDLLARAGVEAPRDWPELLRACERLKAAGIEPVALGTRDLWPSAGWFDYIDLRQNGHAFHMALMFGEVPYSDARVAAVFARWRELVDRGCFVRDHASMSWQESQALLYRGDAAMMLIGNYIVPNFPADVAPLIDLVRFPTIDPALGRFEEAPVNSLHIPARARNKEDARRFLAYLLRPEVQERLNRRLLLIPVNTRSGVAEDRFLQQGAALLAEAEGLSQYFDRDTSEELAQVAMKAFQEFLSKPDRLDEALLLVERVRQRVYRR
jgi:multiple sugar transport system substrate-binding protein